MWTDNATILAIASGDRPSPRGVIRVSGPESIDLLQQVAVGDLTADDLPLPRFPSRRTVFVQLDGFAEPLSVQAFIWPGRRSYTAEPSVELHTIGSPVILQLLLQRLIAAGGRLAAPGEFTFRAFRAGRIDLVQAEAVLGVIHAQDQRQLSSALANLSGGLADPLQRLRADAIATLADLEAGLDFVDEDIEFIDSRQLIDRLDALSTQLRELSQQIDNRSHVREATHVVLVGAANVGKSSLVNALARRQAAIVADAVGTTRDAIRVCLRAGTEMATDAVATGGTSMNAAATVDLIDTAGLTLATTIATDGQDAIDRAAADQRRRELRGADLILVCVDDQKLPPAVFDVLEAEINAAASSAAIPCWLIRTKCDRGPTTQQPSIAVRETYETSVADSGGIDRLRSAIGQFATRSPANRPLALSLARCQQSLVLATQAAAEAALLARRGTATEGDRNDDSFAPRPDELIAASLRVALDHLGDVAGHITNDDVLDALFSRFCIGK